MLKGNLIKQQFVILALLVAGSLAIAGCSIKPEMAVKDDKELAKSLPAIIEESNWASTSNLNKNDNIESAQIITHNDKAFQSKVDVIKGATKTLDLMYFIYSTDESSSVMTIELIKAARDRGVKVRLMVDYLTNYKNLDYFRMMEREGAGNLEVRFYGRPTRNIVKDAVYMTMKCADDVTASDCNQKKFEKLAEIFTEDDKTGKAYSNMNVGLSGLFLSGLYSKNPQVMALAIQAGQEIGSIEAVGKKEMTDEDKQGLKKIAKLMWEANTGSFLTRVGARIQLGLARILYGDVVSPIIDGTYSALPVGRAGHYKSDQDWKFISDYMHMKIVTADGLVAHLGGRNVENSYHIDNPTLSNGETLTGKYIFMDTDMVIKLKQSNQEIRNAYSRVWEFEQMVSSLSDVAKHAPNDFIVNMKSIEDVITQNECKAQSGTLIGQQTELAKLTDKGAIESVTAELLASKKDLESCVTAVLPTYWGKADAIVSKARRMDDAKATMEANAGKYLSFYTQKSDYEMGVDIFDIDPKSASIYYLENTPFKKGANSSQSEVTSTRLSERKFGSYNGKEHDSGKDIHAAWVQGLRQACVDSQTKPEGQKTTVVLHNAYFLLPSNLHFTVADMVKDNECSRVQIQVLTNSLFTTDLNVVNLVSRHSLKAFADYYKKVKADNPTEGATVDYYEYEAIAGDAGPNRSLHTKVSVLGDSCMIVASANADVRSYMMDSNNGFLFCVDREKAKANRTTPVIDTYKKFVNNLIETRATKTDVIEYANRNREELLAYDHEVIKAMAAKYRAERWLDAEQMEKIIAYIDSLLDSAHELSVQSISEGVDSEAADKFNFMFKTL